jgi:peptidoglycan/LPS O-acetylase OafA/YrhL
MRAVFVLGVVAYHLWAGTGHWSVDPGSVAVAGFFALSGYLITGLLLKEHERTGRVHMPHFYARRALRLLPALLFFLGVWLLVDLLFQRGSSWPPCHGSAPAEEWSAPRSVGSRPSGS